MSAIPAYTVTIENETALVFDNTDDEEVAALDFIGFRFTVDQNIHVNPGAKFTCTVTSIIRKGEEP